MSIVALLVTLLVIVFALWLVTAFMPEPFKTPTLVIVVVLALIWIVTLVFPGLSAIRVRL